MDIAWGSKHLLLQIKQWLPYFYRLHNHLHILVIWNLDNPSTNVTNGFVYDCINASCLFLCMFMWYFHSLFSSRCFPYFDFFTYTMYSRVNHLCGCCLERAWNKSCGRLGIGDLMLCVWTCGIIDRQKWLMHTAVSLHYFPFMPVFPQYIPEQLLWNRLVCYVSVKYNLMPLLY
jgi:hypothetical protein